MQHRVRHDDADGSAGDAEAAQLDRGDRHHGGLAGAHCVGEKGAAVTVAEDAGHSVELVRPRAKPAARSVELEVAAVPAWFDVVVERVVVDGGEPLGTVGVAPHPVGEQVFELGALGRGRCGGVGVDDATSFDLGGDPGGALVGEVLDQFDGAAPRVDGVGVFVVGAVAAGGDRPVASSGTCTTSACGSASSSTRNWRTSSAGIHVAPNRGAMSCAASQAGCTASSASMLRR